MAEKYKHKNKCFLKGGIFNIFLSFVFATSLLVLAITMSRTIPSHHFYKLAVCGDQIFTGKENLSKLSPLEFRYICNVTANVNMLEKVKSKAASDMGTGTAQPTVVTTAATTTIDDDLEMLRFHREFVKAAKKEEAFGKGNKAYRRELASQNDFNMPTIIESTSDTEFEMAAQREQKANIGSKMASGKEIAPKTEAFADSKNIQSIQRASMAVSKNAMSNRNKREEELKHFEKYVNDSVNRENLSQSMKMQNKSAAPKLKHFAFLKVHKAGSTTMQNIFFRFGLKNNLTFVLPRHGHYLRRAKDVLPVHDGEHHDILSNHIANFKNHFFRKFIPSDLVNLAIIREPLDRMISAAFYYREVWSTKYLMNIPKNQFILNLIRKADKYEKNNLSKTKNSMGLDFGFPKTITAKNKLEIAQRMTRLKKKFKLVMVMEKFDESLILLKRTMNWDISDVMYLPTNSHDHKKMHLSPGDMAKFKATNFLDYLIYDTFTGILDDEIKAGGQDFKDEVEYFKNILQFAKKFCDNHSRDRNEVLRIPASKWNKPFDFPYTECVYIKMKELDFVDRLKIRHLKMHHLSRSYIVKS